MSDPVPDEDEDHGGEGGDGDRHEDADRRTQEGRLVPVVALRGRHYHGGRGRGVYPSAYIFINRGYYVDWSDRISVIYIHCISPRPIHSISRIVRVLCCIVYFVKHIITPIYKG